jgi:hypothetical protein
MWQTLAVKALGKGKVLEFQYDGYSRWVEVHAVGWSSKDHPIMRCWQVRGGSVHNEPVGWKLMRTDEAYGIVITDERSQAPRPGYRSGDRAMRSIIAQL